MQRYIFTMEPEDTQLSTRMRKKSRDNPACSHLTKQAQSIIPPAPLCYSPDLPHYRHNYLHTDTHTHPPEAGVGEKVRAEMNMMGSERPPETDLSPSGTPVNDLCHGCVGIH